MSWLLPADGLPALLEALSADGYTVVGPTLQQGAIVYDRIRQVDDLPRGWTDEQEPGRYRLLRRDDEAYFGYVVGPHSWKKYLFPPWQTVLRARASGEGWQFEVPPVDPPRLALLGVRACELAALAIQDRVFCEGPAADPWYQLQRERLFLVAVNCTQAAATCFCVSMGTGPRCQTGFDLALTEIDTGLVLEVGSAKGQALASRLPLRPATPADEAQAEARRARACQQSRKIDREAVHDLLLAHLQHPRWQEVAQRCLACANCTLVCPTCFCSSVEEVSDLTGQAIERQRRWDSCFHLDFSYLSGGVVRSQIAARYRQWLTHKLATWIDQFGTSGCVGCGRCITWCPVGIDVTEEVAAIAASPP
jgi:ferredoxin